MHSDTTAAADPRETTGLLSVSIVVPVYQGARWLGCCLDALEAQDYPPDLCETIVVDDGSTDGSLEVASGRSGIETIAAPHAGRPAALNRGIARARGEVVLFTDADCAPPVDWARRLVDLLAARPDLAGVGGNQLPERITAVEAAKVLRYLHEFEREYVLSGAYTRFCLNGNNMAVRRKALEEVGGFDETYLHGADADLTRRLLEAGFRLLRTPESCVVHLKEDGLASHLRTSFRRGSTIRFPLARGEYRAWHLARALGSVPWHLPGDVAAALHLGELDRPVSPRAQLAAPWINALAGLVNWAGQAHHYRRFTRAAYDRMHRPAG